LDGNIDDADNLEHNNWWRWWWGSHVVSLWSCYKANPCLTVHA